MCRLRGISFHVNGRAISLMSQGDKILKYTQLSISLCMSKSQEIDTAHAVQGQYSEPDLHIADYVVVLQ